MKNVLLSFLLITMWTFPVSGEIKILAFAGSTREDSFNRKLLRDAVEMARQMGASVTVVDLKDYPMPFYNAELEVKQGMPENAKRLRELMINHDAFIIASPEYNSSIPALVKNTIDWVSRSETGGSSKLPFEGKKFAIMSASPGKRGGSRALMHLRAVLEDVRGIVIPQQVTIPLAHEYFSEKQRPENHLLKEELQQLLQPAAVR
jgi:chromate reductase, NAD(P)H dehydrogenase (quinone)